MSEIDTRFLTVHPRTRLWWVQREQCAQCKHCKTAARAATRSEPRNRVMQCGAGKAKAKTDRSCILAREEGNRCGPEAKLFQPREEMKA